MGYPLQKKGNVNSLICKGHTKMFSDSSIKKLLKAAGALRVGKDAIKDFKELIEKYALMIARKAIKNAEYSGRKSVKAEDIKESIKNEE